MPSSKGRQREKDQRRRRHQRRQRAVLPEPGGAKRNEQRRARRPVLGEELRRRRRCDRDRARQLDVLHRENLVAVLDEFAITSLGETDIDHINRVWHRLDPWPDVVAGLARLKTRYVLATLSNGNVAIMVNMARHAGLPWDAILGAEVAGDVVRRMTLSSMPASAA